MEANMDLLNLAAHLNALFAALNRPKDLMSFKLLESMWCSSSC